MTPTMTNIEQNTTIEYQDIFERHEKKYLLTEVQYKQLREKLDAFMSVDQYGKTTILNIYYDTPSYRLIRHSIEGPIYKEKLRLRCYNVPTAHSPAFVEIKKKYRGIVYKRRIALPYTEAIAYLEEDVPVREPSQISGEIDYFKQFYGDLETKMVIAYERIAMIGNYDPDLRITFDRNIRWRNTDLDLREGAAGASILEPGQVLMEVKIKDALSWELAKLFSDLQIYSVSYSKYGCAYQQWFTQTGRQDLRWLAPVKQKAQAGTQTEAAWQHHLASA